MPSTGTIGKPRDRCQRSIRPSGENHRRRTRAPCLDIAPAGSAGRNRANGKPLHSLRAMRKGVRRTGKIDALCRHGSNFDGAATLAAIPLTRGRNVTRRLLRAITKHFCSAACGRWRRQRGYQQKKAGERCAKEAKSPTNRSMLLPCCCQTPCLSMPLSRFNILSSGQYVGRIGTVHPQGKTFAKFRRFIALRARISLTIPLEGKVVAGSAP